MLHFQFVPESKSVIFNVLLDLLEVISSVPLFFSCSFSVYQFSTPSEKQIVCYKSFLSCDIRMREQQIKLLMLLSYNNRILLTTNTEVVICNCILESVRDHMCKIHFYSMTTKSEKILATRFRLLCSTKYMTLFNLANVYFQIDSFQL